MINKLILHFIVNQYLEATQYIQKINKRSNPKKSQLSISELSTHYQPYKLKSQHIPIFRPISNQMSHHKNHLAQNFHNLSQQNKQLHQNIISITLNHQNILQQNKQLKSQIKRQQYSLIQSNLRQKNLQHNLSSLQKQYNKLQDQYKTLYDWLKAQKKVQLRQIYKKQTQFIMDLAFIQGQSYRQAKKSQNQQLNNYQQKIINLLKENQSLKNDVLSMTSDYNNKIYELKKKMIQNQVKLKNVQSFNKERINFNSSMGNNLQKNRIQQLQIKVQNLTETLNVYREQNKLIKAKNQTLLNQIKHLNYTNKKIVQKVQEETKSQNNSYHSQLPNNSSQYITQILKQNIKLNKQIEQISTKYTLLTQTYPNLIESYEQIKNLQENIQKYNKITDLQNQLTDLSIELSKGQLSYKTLQKKYLEQLKQNQALEYKISILSKRFNEIFIKINPYFAIYKYEDLELDENMFRFFDQNKDYKQLKEYENKILGLKRQIKEKQQNYLNKQNEFNVLVQQKQSLITKLTTKNSQSETTIKNLTQSNLLLKSVIKNNNLQHEVQIKQNQQNIPRDSDIQTQISVPLLQNLIEKLHTERQQLLKIIYQKDKKIVELQQQISHLTIQQPIQTIRLQANQNLSHSLSSQSSTQNFSQLIKQNQKLQQNYDLTIQALREQITRIRTEFTHQTNLYQLEVKQYQRQYELKLQQINKLFNDSIKNCQNFKNTLEEIQNKREKEKQVSKNLQNQQNQQLNRLNQQMEHNIMQEQNRMNQQPNQNENILLRHPSHTNLQRIPVVDNQDGNRLIGESTVQNLTTTLKKYQHDMNQVLQMCSKISQQYSDLKQKLKNQEQLQMEIVSMKQKFQALMEQKTTLYNQLNQKNHTLSSIESLYNMKSNQLEQVKNLAKSETKSLEEKLEEEKRKNNHLVSQLTHIKQKMYQLNSKPIESGSQGAVSNGQFETIVVMHANKNKQMNQLAQKNSFLESKVESLMKEVNLMKQTALQRKSQEMSPLERAEVRQLSEMLQQTNIIELIKRANQIVEKQSRKQADEKIAY